ncbi:hypothetical protein [Vibrio sp. ED002]|uniref:hypothetical protein n=1 Tax=Vibrio sp. ED002 TaxID=2785123 RepID=UPI00200D8CCC|nr:hypothetical protein [Vibrio sp. ED002]UQA50994.1 hypothetical protein ITG12_01250 [Vibrio sp. ED002]
MKREKLNCRFHEYLMSCDHVEDVDELDELFAKSDGTQSKKPDYFLANRAIILEKKILLADPYDKVVDYIRELLDSDLEFLKVASVSHSIEEVFQRHPQGMSLKSKFLDKMYKGFRNNVMKPANKQLKNSSEHLGLNDAMKGVLLLNEDVDTFQHEHLVEEIQVQLTRKSESEAIDFVILISETEREKSNGGSSYSVIYSESCDNIQYLKVRIENSLMLGWAAFSGSLVQR